MDELSLNILDLVQNSLRADATWVKVVVMEDLVLDHFILEIHDNGRGMPKEFLNNIFDPFTTTRKTRRVGLGLSLLDMAARRCNGQVRVNSELGQGTYIQAVFQHSHWDRAPLGDIKATLITLISANPGLHLEYLHRVNDKTFSLDTRELREVLGEEIPLNDLAVLGWLEEYLIQGFIDLYGGENK